MYGKTNSKQHFLTGYFYHMERISIIRSIVHFSSTNCINVKHRAIKSKPPKTVDFILKAIWICTKIDIRIEAKKEVCLARGIKCTFDQISAAFALEIIVNRCCVVWRCYHTEARRMQILENESRAVKVYIQTNPTVGKYPRNKPWKRENRKCCTYLVTNLGYCS